MLSELHTKTRYVQVHACPYVPAFGLFQQVRPYTPESTGSRPISEVKLVMAKSVLWWGTTREYFVLYFLDFLLTILQCFTVCMGRNVFIFRLSQACFWPIPKLLDLVKKKKKLPKIYVARPIRPRRVLTLNTIGHGDPPGMCGPLLIVAWAAEFYPLHCSPQKLMMRQPWDPSLWRLVSKALLVGPMWRFLSLGLNGSCKTGQCAQFLLAAEACITSPRWVRGKLKPTQKAVSRLGT